MKNFFLEHPKKKNVIIIIFFLIILLMQLSVCLITHFVLKNKDNNLVNSNLNEISNSILNEVNFITTFIKNSLNRSAAILRINGIYTSRKDFIDYMQYENSPIKSSIESFFWIAKLPGNEKTIFEDFCKKNIKENCSISEIGVNRTLVPVGNKEYYWPISNASPFLSISGSILGFDLNSNNITKIFIDFSLLDEFTSTVRINLGTRPNNPNSFGVLVNKLAYKNLEEFSFHNINGISSCIININDILTYTINVLNLTLLRKDVDLFVFDNSNDNLVDNKKLNVSLLFKENKDEYKNIWFYDDEYFKNNELLFKYNFDWINRKWIIYFKYSDSFMDSNRNENYIFIPIVIAIASILVNIIIIIIYNSVNSVVQKKNIANQMLGYVNHEVRNPLNVIKGLVNFTRDNLMKLEVSKEENINVEKKYFDTIVSDLSTAGNACDMIEHIVTDILDIRKLEEGKLDLNYKVIEIENFIKDLIKTLSQKFNENQNVKLILDYDKKLTLFVDSFRLKQILLNYLTNSIKFTEKGSITIKIIEFENYVKFMVIDTGKGIISSSKSKIFQPFNQINKEDSIRHNGIGLGLYLCKMLASCMKGKVGFESEYKIGSTFCVELPKIGDMKTVTPV